MENNIIFSKTSFYQASILFFSLNQFKVIVIDRMHKWWPKKYSFVFVLISLTSLVSTDKIEKKSSFRMRLVGLISTKTKE